MIPLRVREVTNPYPGKSLRYQEGFKSLRYQEGFYTPSILSSLTPLPFVAIWGFSRLYGTFYGGDPTHGF